MQVTEDVLDGFDELHRFVILLADVNDEPVRGRTKLQKIMYMLSDMVPEIGKQCGYKTGSDGPYSEVVDAEMQYLEQMCILKVTSSGWIEPTKKGKDLAKQLWVRENYQHIKDSLLECKSFINDMTDNQLLTYMYLAYSHMVDESDEYERLKPDMEKYVFELLAKEKISAQKAAELLHETLHYVLEKMKEKQMLMLED